MDYQECLNRFEAIIQVMNEKQFNSEEFYFVCRSYERNSFINDALEKGYKLEFTSENFARFTRV